MEPTQPDATSAPTSKRRGPPYTAVVFLILFAVMVVGLALTIRNRSKPQLDLRNVGTKPVLVRSGGESVIVGPGREYHARFSGGETLQIFAGEKDSAPSRSVTLEKRGPLTGSPPRVAAEVNADDGGKIVFRYVDGG